MVKEIPPVFILCAGSQKSGTTWMAQYIRQFDNADFGKKKEYHVWDRLFVKGFYKPSIARRARDYVKRMRHLIVKKVTGKIRYLDLRYSMTRNTENYFNYFEQLLEQPGIDLTGDITPSYSALPMEAFAQIKAGFDARGIKVKVVFLMRDPVERCWSTVRMLKRKNRPRDQFDITSSDENALLEYILTDHAQHRTSYHQTLENLYRVFEREDIYVGIFEKMFTVSEIKRLSRFAGVQELVGFAEKNTNPGPKSESISPETRKTVKDHFAQVYQYCYENYPETKELWR